jgi:hypothetical protein
MVGASECIENLLAKSVAIDSNVRYVVDSGSDIIFQLSTEVFCPVDKGPLKASAKNEIHDTGTEYYHELSYETPYCWWVHELPYRHYNPPTAQRKYLETPVNMMNQTILTKMKTAFIKSAFGEAL